MINQFNDLNQKIQLLRSTGDILLQKINRLETYLNKRKQQNQYPFKEDINLLNQLVKRQLQMLAEIKTCQYYQATFETINIFSPRYIEMCNRLFENLMRQFLNDLQIKRYKRYKRYKRLQQLQQLQQQEQQQLQLQCHSYQQIINDIFDPVDFKIQQ